MTAAITFALARRLHLHRTRQRPFSAPTYPPGGASATTAGGIPPHPFTGGDTPPPPGTVAYWPAVQAWITRPDIADAIARCDPDLIPFKETPSC